MYYIHTINKNSKCKRAIFLKLYADLKLLLKKKSIAFSKHNIFKQFGLLAMFCASFNVIQNRTCFVIIPHTAKKLKIIVN